MNTLKELLESERLILMGVQEYPTVEGVTFWGGMGVVCKSISELLVHRGFEVLVLPRQVTGYQAQQIIYTAKNGVHVLALPTKTYQAGAENTELYELCPSPEGMMGLDHAFTTWRYLTENGLKHGIVHGHDWLGAGYLVAAKQANLKTAFSVHMSSDRTIQDKLLDKRLELENVAGNCADIIHYVSLSQKIACVTHNWGNHKSNIVIPNGVDVDKFLPPKETLTEDYILFVGRLTPEKNVPSLVKGWSMFNKNFPSVKLVILGAPGLSLVDVKREIDALSPEQKERVTLKIEMVTEQERIDYYQKSSVCCFPSGKEAFGIVALEAQSCGKPVVVGNVGGFWENTVEGTTGVHVQGNSPESIAQGLEVAYTSRNAWGKNARKFVAEFFSWNTIVEKYIENIYNPLLE